MEKDNIIDDPEYLKWLNMLIPPGSSLGGARPKASVADQKNNLWIAKFPSGNDIKDIGAWEMIVNELARKAGLNIAEAKAQKFSGHHHTYLSKRFDRTNSGERIHFAFRYATRIQAGLILTLMPPSPPKKLLSEKPWQNNKIRPESLIL